MTDKEQDVPCAICYGNLTIPMSKKEMADLLKTLGTSAQKVGDML